MQFRLKGVLPKTGWLLAPLLIFAARMAFAQSSQAVYTDSLQNGWQNWSWATVSLNNTAPVHSGTVSISVSCTNYQGFYLHQTAFDSTPYASLSFWINGGSTGGQPLIVQATTNGYAINTSYTIPSPAPNAWQLVVVPLSSINANNRPNMDGFWIQSMSAGQLATFYLDDITLVAGTNAPVTNTPVAIAIDVLANRHPISPLIYGVAFATSNQVADLNTPLNRSGGNAETRYNWVTNAHNRAADWYFESIADSPATPGAAGDDFVANTKDGGAQPMVTIPMIGWAPKIGASRGKLASYSIAKYGPQAGNDSAYYSDAGNGVGTNSVGHTSWLITTNNPADANFTVDSSFEQAWVQHLTNRWGLSTNGGVGYYIMDNEHSIWHSTQRDIHPVGATMQEIRDKIFDYAARVKAVDPAALVLAAEEWGWSGYFYSGYDQQWAGAHNDYNPAHYPDRGTNGGWDYMPWLLDQARQRATNTNQRLLDVFTVHIYPQGGESGNDISASTQLLRNRSTRSLWDTNYVDASWINSIVKLIPRMKNWVATYYPGTQIGITEYNWGAEAYINGATAQADIFGIFGRESLDLATRWTTPDSTTPTYKAMKLYRNYDGNKSTFGEISVSASVPNPDNVAAFAAIRAADNALTVMMINKQLGASATATLTLSNFVPAGTEQVWQLTSANTITRLPDTNFVGTTLTNSLPPQSITLLILPAGTPPRLRAGTYNGTNGFDFWLDGVSGQRYVTQTSTDLANWAPIQTNSLPSASLHVVVSADSGPRFYRAQWIP